MTCPTICLCFHADDDIRDDLVTGVQTCALPISFNVSGATDLAGNTQVAATNVSTGTDVDTQNATVLSVSLSDPHITDSDSRSEERRVGKESKSKSPRSK